jgi:hypothetical protein
MSNMNVFISHASKDRVLAKRVAESLKLFGFQVWDESQVLPGAIIAEQLTEALKSANAMVVLLTPEAVESAWVQSEISYALGKKDFKGRVIPVIAASAEELPQEKIPWVLRKFQMINLSELGSEEGLKEIVNALQQTA